MYKRELNLRDLGGSSFDMGMIPRGLCQKYHINCVIDLRTPVEAAEFPDLLPNDVNYIQIPLIKDAAVGISHETGSDPMTIIRRLRKHPEKLKEMVPDFMALYRDVVTDVFSRRQLDKVVATLKSNAEKGLCTLFHCTAGKDRTGIVSMALLKSYGVPEKDIIHDYMRTNRNAFLPTMKKCIGIGLMTWNWDLVKIAYQSFMARKELIQIAIKHYE